MTDDEVDGNAIIPFAYGKALLSTSLYMDLMHECQGNFWNATKGESPASPCLHATTTFTFTFVHVTRFRYSVSLVCCILLSSVYYSACLWTAFLKTRHMANAHAHNLHTVSCCMDHLSAPMCTHVQALIVTSCWMRCMMI